MIDPKDRHLSISRQSELLGISRSHHYYNPRPERREDIEEKIRLKEMFLKYPFYGYRKQVLELEREGISSTLKRVRRPMHEMGLKALSPRHLTSIPKKEHPVYPDLLRGKRIRYPNQVWATDITYLRLDGGFVYLVAIMDLYSRKILSWRISLNMEADFCVEALKDAMATYGVPAIFNTDQGSQFTSYGFLQVLKNAGVQVSMDGRGSWRDNIYVERFWRTLKYEDIYLNAYESVRDLKQGLKRYFRFYNGHRFQQNLDYRPPNQMYESFRVEEELAAA